MGEVAQDKGNCSFQRNPTPCVIPQEKENIFHTIFAFFTKSGRKVLDCERPGRSCLIVHCNLTSLAKAESRSIDVYMLLNTEILKKDSSSVIQFVTRAKVRVDTTIRVVEVPNGNSENATMIAQINCLKSTVTDYDLQKTYGVYESNFGGPG
uniref:Integrin alpha-9 n=1 Tax=Sphaerodactylus townsendi TaxID=933632 RepID=A0ACB8FUA6_9SAUR